MNPKAEIFFDAVTLLREDIVEEAQDYRFRKKTAAWKKFGSLAACLVLIVSLSLLILPMRGCGGSAPKGDMNSSGAPPMQSTDSCAPANEPASSEPMPEPGEAPDTPEVGYGQAGTVQFTAVVIEMDDYSILVEPLEDERLQNSYGQLLVVTRDLELPELAVGDEVRITYDGWIAESDPAVISGAAAVEQIEEN